MKMSQLVANISATFLTRMIIIGLSVITGIITARALGPEGKGILAAITAVTGIALQFGNLGLHASNTYLVSKDQQALPKIAGNNVWVSIVGGTLIGSAIVILGWASPATLGDVPLGLLSIAVIALPFSFLTLFGQNLMIGLQRIRRYNAIELLGTLFALIVTIAIFVILHFGVRAAVWMTSGITITSAIMYLWAQRKETPFASRFDGSLFQQMFRYGFKSYVASLLSYFIIRSDVLLLNGFRGASETGIYSIAVQFADLLYLLPITAGTMLFPVIARLQEAQEQSETTQRITRNLFPLLLGLSAIVAVIITPIISFFFGSAFSAAALPLIILLPGIIFLSLETILIYDLSGRGLPPVTYITPAIGFVLNLGLNIWLIPSHGMIAAAVSSSIAYFIMFMIVASVYVRRYGGHWHALLIPRPGEIVQFIKNIIHR